MTTTPQFLHLTQLCKRWGVSKMFVERRLRQDASFPRPFKFDDRPTSWRYWKLEEVEEWERARVAKRV